MIALNKKIIATALILIMSTSLAGCGSSQAKSLKQAIANNEPVNIEVYAEEGAIMANPNNHTEWKMTSDIDDHVKLRQDLDTLVNTNVITNSLGKNSKQSCLYVVKNEDGNDAQSANSCLRDAIRNKKFNEYWEDTAVNTEVDNLVKETYKDVTPGTPVSDRAALNAYFDIYNDTQDDDTYDSNIILSREEFYTLMYKAGHGVTEFNQEELEDYKSKVGVDTFYTNFASQLDKYAYINTTNGLTGKILQQPITKMEALYIVSNYYFPEMVETVELSGQAFGKKCENVAKTCGAMYYDKETKSDIWRDNWQLSTLAYMSALDNKVGIDESLFKQVKVAEMGNLTAGINFNSLYEPITKDQALTLMINVFNAETSLEGYLTNSEYSSYVISDIDDRLIPINSINIEVTYN